MYALRIILLPSYVKKTSVMEEFQTDDMYVQTGTHATETIMEFPHTTTNDVFIISKNIH